MKSAQIKTKSTSSRLLRKFLNSLPHNLVENTSQFQLEFEGLAECSCEPEYKENSFNRLLNNRRKNTEDDIISRAKKNFSAQKELSCLSMGAGKLLQDFILCSKLILEGFSLNITLIEPCEDDKFQAALKRFSQLKKHANNIGLSFKVQHFKDAQEFLYTNPGKKIDIAWIIDFDKWDEEFESLCLLQNSLSEKSIFVFAGRAGNAIFNTEQKKPEITNCDKRVEETLHYALEQYQLGSLNPEFYYYVAFLFLPHYFHLIKDTEQTIASATRIKTPNILHNILSYRGLLGEDIITDPILFQMLVEMNQSIEQRKSFSQYVVSNDETESETRIASQVSITI